MHRPSSFEYKTFEQFAMSGVSRFSLAAQVLNNNENLRWLGLLNNAAQALAELKLVDVKHSFDLIYEIARQIEIILTMKICPRKTYQQIFS